MNYFTAGLYGDYPAYKKIKSLLGPDDKLWILGDILDGNDEHPEDCLRILDDIQKLSNKLWHSIAGAVYIEHKLGIKDKELLDAVRYHTTARADATLMDKILYIADYVSAERNFDGVEGLRKDLEKSLDLCYRNALQMSILELSQRLKPIHFDTFYAYNSSLME